MKRAHLELHFAVVLFGISGLFGKLIAASPAMIVFGRTVFASIAILLGLILVKKGIAASSRKLMGFMILSGAVLMLHWLVFFHSIQVSTVAVGLIGFSTFPIFVTILEPLLYKQKYRRIDIVSGILVTVGLLFVAPVTDFSDSMTVGLFWAVVSGALYAVLALMNRRFVETDSFMVVALYQHSAAALCALPFLIGKEGMPGSGTILLLAILGVVCTALPQTLFIKSLARIKAQLASVVAALEPVYGIIFAALLLGEIPSVRTVGGAVVVLAAVSLAMQANTAPE